MRADTYIEELEKFAPKIVAACQESIDNAIIDGDFIRPDADAFESSPSDSIDYAVMEKTDRGCSGAVMRRLERCGFLGGAT